MRECIITRDDISALQNARNPAPIVAKLKAAGFVLERETCPIKIATPWSQEGQPDGTVKFLQDERAKNTP